MANQAKPLILNDSQFLDFGAFADVYRISPRRIVKVFRTEEFSCKEIEDLVADEVKVSQQRGHLPVLRVIKVQCPDNDKITFGLVKRYLPVEAKLSDSLNLGIDYWDDHVGNLRKDSKGKVFIIDSQSKKMRNLI